MVYTLRFASPLGKILLAERSGSLLGLWFEGQKYFPEMQSGAAEKETECLAQTADWLERYFRGERPDAVALKLAPEGSEFRRKVWALLREIPYGETLSYGTLAERLGNGSSGGRMSAQAVGGAVGHNPISIIIPCHRVVGTRGNLTGYAGGVEKKAFLLRHEGADMSRLYIPKNGTAL